MKANNAFSHPREKKELAMKYMGKMMDREVGHLVGVHKATIYRWRTDAGIKAFKGGPEYIPKTVSDLWLPNLQYQAALRSWKRPEGLAEEIAKIKHYRFLLHLYKMERCV
jgi:hypothetical protein